MTPQSAAPQTPTITERPPEWPLKRGTAVSVYLDDSGTHDRAEIVDVTGRVVQVRLARRRDLPGGGHVKMLVNGKASDWGYDLTVMEVETRGNLWRLRLDRGPIPLTRDAADRIVERTLVVFRRNASIFPGHILERGPTDLLCIVGRGAPFDDGDSIQIEFRDKDVTPLVGTIAWRRAVVNGLEFGLELPPAA